MRMITTLIFGASFAGMVAADARADLYNETDINAGLLVVAVADKIRRECNGISGRLFRARGYVNSLKSMAEDRGYSQSEIEAYVNNSENKAEMRLRRNAYYKSKGASNLDHESLCVLGYAEIREKSQVGALLKAK